MSLCAGPPDPHGPRLPVNVSVGKQGNAVEQARFAEAERALSEAVARDPAFAPGRYWRAVALRGLERWTEALDDPRTTCALAPDHPRAAALRDQVQAALESAERNP